MLKNQAQQNGRRHNRNAKHDAIQPLRFLAHILLLVPQSGKLTRAVLQRQSAEWRKQAAETLGDAAAEGRDKARPTTFDARRQAEKLEQRVLAKHGKQ